MSINFSDSVVLITSSSAEHSRNFGTGFVIYQDEQVTYLLTCAHVVRDVGGSEQIKADGMPATVAASGDEQGFDLAVLRIEGVLDKPRLSLCAIGEEEKSFIISGFYEFASRTPPVLRNLRGNLGEQIKLTSSDRRERINAWDLRIESKHHLQPGYSGSPVIDEATGYVLGVVSYRIGKGEEGLAISIEALNKIWVKMPHYLINRATIADINLRSKKLQNDSSILIKIPIRWKKQLERLNNDILVQEEDEKDLSSKIRVIEKQIKTLLGAEEEYKLKKRLTELQQKRCEFRENLDQLYEQKDSLLQRLEEAERLA
jgi:hypothetical protein